MRRVSDQYDYMEIYQKQTDSLSPDEDDRQRCSKGYIYKTKTTRAGRYAQIEIYPVFLRTYDVPRVNGGKESKRSQRNLNHKRSIQYFKNLLHANFSTGDIWSTHTFDDEHLPKDSKDAMKKWTAYIRKVNRHRAKEGLPNLKYVYVCESEEEKTRYHFHMVCDRSQDRDMLEKLWTYGKRTQTRRLVEDEDTGLTGMATYIAKDETKYPSRKKSEKRWSGSKGLKKPIVSESKNKFRKRKVQRMARDYEELMAAVTSKYPEYKIVDTQIYINDMYAGIYIRIDAVKRATSQRRLE